MRVSAVGAEASRHVIVAIRFAGGQSHRMLMLFAAKRVEEKYRDMELYAGETLTLVMKRWEKLEKDFYSKKKERFDIRYGDVTMTLCTGFRATRAKSGQYVNANQCSTDTVCAARYPTFTTASSSTASITGRSCFSSWKGCLVWRSRQASMWPACGSLGLPFHASGETETVRVSARSRKSVLILDEMTASTH
jgi:hypothetical protein